MRRLSPQSWARITAIGLVLLALLVSATSLRAGRGGSAQRVAAARDPLQAELAHCQALGQAGASDAGCLAAWADSRRRFLAGSARP